jgi:hypothetical protein
VGAWAANPPTPLPGGGACVLHRTHTHASDAADADAAPSPCSCSHSSCRSATSSALALRVCAVLMCQWRRLFSSV